MNIVECQNVSKSYCQGNITVPALQEVNLVIEKGEFVTLAGPSGSGKTTLLNAIGGLDAIDAGSIRIDGRAVESMSQSGLAEMRLNKIGFVFQAYNLIPVLSALENVEYVMQLQGIPARQRQERARAAIDKVGLSGYYHRRPAELSGGQQQRVAVARAVVSEPAIILADEPTANLDSETGRGLLDMMRAMNADSHMTFIFSTHDQMVMDYARRQVFLKDGRIIQN
jgi:putative ABC transport system ATP-binding protein